MVESLLTGRPAEVLNTSPVSAVLQVRSNHVIVLYIALYQYVPNVEQKAYLTEPREQPKYKDVRELERS
jgi:hypothetical protein